MLQTNTNANANTNSATNERGWVRAVVENVVVTCPLHKLKWVASNAFGFHRKWQRNAFLFTSKDSTAWQKGGGESKPLRNCSAIEMAKSNKRQPDISVGEGMVDQEGGVSCIWLKLKILGPSQGFDVDHSAISAGYSALLWAPLSPSLFQSWDPVPWHWFMWGNLMKGPLPVISPGPGGAALIVWLSLANINYTALGRCGTTAKSATLRIRSVVSLESLNPSSITIKSIRNYASIWLKVSWHILAGSDTELWH